MTNCDAVEGLEEHLFGRFESQSFMGASVELIRNQHNFIVGHRRQIPTFRQVLADRAVGVLIAGPLTACTWSAEIRLAAYSSIKRCMPSKLTAVVCGCRLDLVSYRLKQLNHCLTGAQGVASGQQGDHQIARLALNAREQPATVKRSHNGVQLPVTYLTIKSQLHFEFELPCSTR